MNTLPGSAQRYLHKFGAKGVWRLSGNEQTGFAGAVVIPALAEGESLFRTLDSLADNPPIQLQDFLVIIVINHGDRATVEIRSQNEADLSCLTGYAQDSPLNLAWVDAITPGYEIPHKQAGVGLARKLGLDLALQRLDWYEDPLLVCLDADTLVEKNYLSAIQNHFRQSLQGATVLPYRHQPGQSREQQDAIDRYELFLRSYVYGLRLAGSPYAFNAVGSAMACRATAYVRSGGMNTRKAAEDFYFLQKLAKTDGIDFLAGTKVMPAPRISERVPFGTGRSMSRMLADDYRGVLIYPVEVFRILGQWLALVAGDSNRDAESLMQCAREISPVLSDYLERSGWRRLWPGMQRTHQSEAQLIHAFHGWFDGFRSLRLIHLLCEAEFERGEPEALLPGYFAWEGLECPDTMGGMLAKLLADDGV